MTKKITALISALTASFSLGSQPLYAQESTPDSSAPTSGQSDVTYEELESIIAASPDIPSDNSQPEVSVNLNRDFNCGRDPFLPATAADPLGCSFTNTTAGFAFSDRWSIGQNSFGAKVDVTRGTSGAFVLDHQMRGLHEGLDSETIVTNISLDGSFFDDRLEIDGKASWSRSWDVPITLAPLDPHRLNERNGSASQLRVKTRIINTPDTKWSIEGKISQMDEGYRPYRATVRNRLLAAQGSSTSLATSLTIDGWRLRASASSNDTAYLSSDTANFSAGHSGITVRASRRVAETRLDSLLPIPSLSRFTKSRLAVDIEMHSLIPSIAIDDTGWKSLVPKLLTIETTKTEKRRLDLPGGELRTRSAIGGHGYWSTPLGDTLLDLRLENQASSSFGKTGSDLFIFANHSFKISDWSIDLDYFTSRNDFSRGITAPDNTKLASYGITARYARKELPKLEFKLGRDNLGFNTGGGDIRFRDQSLRAQAEVDFTPWLRKKLKREDVQLMLELQYDFERSSYQLLLLDELVDSDFDRVQNRGILVSFSMQLP